MHKQSKGFNWGAGGVSTSIWKGVLVRDLLLNICGGIRKGAKYVCFDGSDKLPNGTYGTSLSVERVLNPMNDVMVAYEMNGAKLTPDHGYPVRLIVPGVIGGRMIKNLAKISVTDTKSESWYHYHDNRVLPSIVTDADMAQREQWWTRPEYIIHDLNINSAISSPAHGSVLSISDPQAMAQEITISGYAYNGGCKKITRVEVTLDSGKTWLLCDLEHPEEWPEFQFCNDPYPRQRYWCWCFWS
ncbi:Oxidoreductase, molybdopterin-binding domain-containing protein, partial [Dissophora ornata]